MVEKEKQSSPTFGNDVASNSKCYEVTDISSIDVTSQSLDLEIKNHFHDPKKNKEIISYCREVPHWEHTYVYSYSELTNASKNQREFYFYFRDCFLNNKLVDIKNNTNYPFILYFDLRNQYKEHQDIELLAKQFKLLNECCPRTKNYTLRSLQQFLRERSSSYSLSIFNGLQTLIDNSILEFSYNLGKRYKSKLDLNEQEVDWLSKFSYTNNHFTQIESCCIATIIQYLQVIKAFDENFKKNATSLKNEISYFEKKIKKLYCKLMGNLYYTGTVFYEQNISIEIEAKLYHTIFQRVENSVRDTFKHSRKVSGNLSIPMPKSDNTINVLIADFENRLGIPVDKLITQLKYKIKEPDYKTQIILNNYNGSRWKREFEELKISFDIAKLKEFTDKLTFIGRVNKKNPNIETIFLRFHEFISQFNVRETSICSMQYYAKYIYYNRKANKFKNKPLTRKVKKLLFETHQQLLEFESIMNILINDLDLKKALSKISKIYILKRKKIIINKKKVKKIEEEDVDTLNLLYKELNKDDEVAIFDHIPKNEKTQICLNKNPQVKPSVNSKLVITENQKSFITKFAHNSFQMSIQDIEIIAVQNGKLKNQFIDEINEIFYDFLNQETLVQEEEDNYVMEKIYYQEILNQI